MAAIHVCGHPRSGREPVAGRGRVDGGRHGEVLRAREGRTAAGAGAGPGQARATRRPGSRPPVLLGPVRLLRRRLRRLAVRRWTTVLVVGLVLWTTPGLAQRATPPSRRSLSELTAEVVRTTQLYRDSVARSLSH